ncbi:MAG: response regulator transcription factor [Anaerolineae bacterium]|nr:response regulator transcription factor [Anaerolineae bacterium]
MDISGAGDLGTVVMEEPVHDACRWRVLAVADDPLARAGLGTLLSMRTEAEVVGQLTGAEAGTGDLSLYRPDVILWDIGWEVTDNSLGCLRQALADLQGWASPRPAFAVLLPDADSAARVWGPGINALLLRDTSLEQLAGMLSALMSGLAVFDPAVVSALITPDPVGYEAAREALTPREQEVLHLLAEGIPNKTIAYRLSISEHTVKFHVNALLGKLGAQSRTEAVVRATRAGLIAL